MIPNKNEFRDFHSFRHLMKTRLSELEKNEGIIDDILGHSSPSRSRAGKTYQHGNRVKLKNDVIQKISFDTIDFNIIRNWKEQIFYRISVKPRARHHSQSQP